MPDFVNIAIKHIKKDAFGSIENAIDEARKAGIKEAMELIQNLNNISLTPEGYIQKVTKTGTEDNVTFEYEHTYEPFNIQIEPLDPRAEDIVYAMAP